MPSESRANHFTGYSYDRQVPLLLAGPGVRSGRFLKPINVIDLVPTLATLLGSLHPAMSEGRVLDEALIP